MYTSGWPKIQNRCSHRSGSAPCSTLKKLASNSRSNVSRNSATEMTGMANTSSTWTTRLIQVNTGIFMSVMPGARRLRHGDHEVDATDERGDAGDLQADGVEVHAVAGREHDAGVGGVGEPAAVGAAAEEPRRVQEDAADEEHPEAQRVEAREGDVAGADLQRDQVVHEGRAHRHDHQEDHRDAVHREDLVVEVGRQQLLLGRGQLRPDDQRLDAADDQEEQRRGAVHDPDLLVVDGAHPRRASPVFARGRAKTPSGLWVDRRRRTAAPAHRWVVRRSPCDSYSSVSR